MAIIVTGFGLSKPKVVIGRGVFVIPIIQRGPAEHAAVKGRC